MANADGGDDEPVELLRTRIGPMLAVPALVFLFSIGWGVWNREPPVWVAAGLSGATLFSAVTLRGTVLLADRTGLLIRRRGRTIRSWRWDEIVEVSVGPAGFGRVGLSVFPTGGPWDVPGPNSATGVGAVFRLPKPDREELDRVRRTLRSYGVRVLDERGRPM